MGQFASSCRALDVSVTFFDTADMYGRGQSEEQLSQVLGERRKDMIIASLPEGARLASNSQKRFADRFLTPKNWDRLERLEAYGKERGRSLLDIAFGWLASKPFIPSVIAGASTPEQVDLNCKAVTCGLTADEVAHGESLFAGA